MEPKPPAPPAAKPAAPPPPPPAAVARKPPPPPPSVGTPAAAAAAPHSTGSLLTQNSTQAKVDLAATALRLRDEQIQAKVIYFGAEQRTNKDLDAITEQVVAELRALQGVTVRTKEAAPAEDEGQTEIELIGMLRTLLEKLFSNRREGFLRRKIEDIQRRITTLFFNSELFTKIAAGSAEARTFAYGDQAVYFVLRKQKESLVAALKALSYTGPGVQQDAVSRLQSIEASLRMDVLSRTTPELEALLAVYLDELVKFLRSFRDGLGEFAWEVVRESRVAHGRLFGYKVPPEKFQEFREVFEKKFLERLVLEVQEPVVKKSTERRDTFREETTRFCADPQIFSEICSVLCDAIYDYLHSEGFLDLPPQWRAHLDRHA